MPNKRSKREGGSLKETISVIIQALFLALLIRSFLVQPFNIPSGSMKPSLLVGDYVFVTKWSYGYSRYSLPFGLPLFSGRVWSGEPARGDIVVFKYPPDPGKDYIKRVIGLPGDEVQLRDSVVYINGEAVDRVDAGKFFDDSNNNRIPMFEERLDGTSYRTLDIRSGSSGDTSRVFVVPPKTYFFLGDNRDNSADSRYDVGFVPAENLVGRAYIIFLSIRGEGGGGAWQIWRWPSDMRWERLFTRL